MFEHNQIFPTVQATITAALQVIGNRQNLVAEVIGFQGHVRGQDETSQEIMEKRKI